MKVLVVDDSESNRQVTLLLLEQLGQQPDAAGNGAQAKDEGRIRRGSDQPTSHAAQSGMVSMEPRVVAEMSQATLCPSPPMRMARM